MASRVEVTERIYELLQQKQSCTLPEAREYLREHNVDMQTDNPALRIIFSNLCKNDPHIERVKRGTYKYVEDLSQNESVSEGEDGVNEAEGDPLKEAAENSNAVSLDSTELTVTEILEYLDQAKTIKWYADPLEDIAENQRKLNHICEIYNTIGEKLHEITGDDSEI